MIHEWRTAKFWVAAFNANDLEMHLHSEKDYASKLNGLPFLLARAANA